jgi:hypothetical protein
MNSRTLTLQTLIDKDACSGQVKLFRAKFGEAVEVTESLCRSVAGEFNWDWAAHNLLSKNSLDDYRAKCNALDDDYWAKCKVLEDDYLAKIKPLEDDYLAKIKQLEDDYRAKIKPLYDDYRAKCAVLFARCYVEDQP